MYDTEELWSEILPGLYQGGTDGADERMFVNVPAQITRKDFDTVVTLYANAGPVDWYVKEVRLGFFDYDEVDLDEHDLAHAVRIALRDWMRGRKVLIRCQAGWNRSGLVTALVLLKAGYTPEDAIELIREKRSAFALCNDHFVDWIYAHGEAFVARITDSPSLAVMTP
jgi:hypothetical protein